MMDLFHTHGCEVFRKDNASCHKGKKVKKLPPTKAD